ncbi:acyl-CoA dehydrogenase family protein [Herbaspirillum rubrisubalbicans]|uniref:Monooxygenase n=1 Tax=Herbaspirillum rubrisubalbicans Os34 TaxID=1235827 RepID=A0A6M3ZM99_9BURK|nr:acyl-CoA dehydrogenase family protein [Herbaspirillum rubrisubalbicans]MCP1576463.1 alkylation response protein AidB-like acyl-CoA dehydrogenase [Herbaspirillum rubrisubalbicans]QJP99698.1 monooxygenase [Herbaspirillum rubrisubalbicans Os34]
MIVEEQASPGATAIAASAAHHYDKQSLRTRLATLRAGLQAGAAAVEQARTVPAASIEALRAIGYFDLVKPQAFGGAQVGFSTLVDMNMILAGWCASTAWVAGLLAAHQWLVASFPQQAQHDIWDANPDALVCGSYAPACQAEAVEGGYLLSGRWSFASGCECAQWSLCAAILPPQAARTTPAPAFLLVPQSDYRIEDTWHVIGLAGTGSKTLVLDRVFVPAHRSLLFSETTSGQTPGAQLYGTASDYAIPMLSVIPSCLASVAVGAAQGALEDYLERTSRRITRGAVAGGQNRMAEFPTIQLRVAEAAAAVDAARKILLADLQEREATVRQGEQVTVEERITSRRGQAFAVSLAIRATEALNASTGGQGLDVSHPVQRAWRDANAVGRHISMNWDTVGTMYGQMALGLEPKGQY